MRGNDLFGMCCIYQCVGFCFKGSVYASGFKPGAGLVCMLMSPAYGAWLL